LILRGKRFGFSLDEIAEMIGMVDVDMSEVDQIEKYLISIDKRCEYIRRRRIDLEFLEKDLFSLEKCLSNEKKELREKSKRT
jgi:hypothetical protein